MTRPMPRTNRPCLRLLVVIALVVTLSSARVLAHARSMSYSTWDIRGRGAHVTVRLSELDLSRFPWAATADREHALAMYLAANLRLMAGDSACGIGDGPRALDAPPGRVVYEWSMNCPATGALRIESTLLFEVAPSHLHFARVAQDGARVMDRVLSDAERSWPLTDASATTKPQPRGTSVVGYLELGVGHIWTGYDHMAFLLALLLHRRPQHHAGTGGARVRAAGAFTR
jgi:hypothetical protein